MGLRWTDSEDIGIELRQKHPQIDPLAIQLSEIHRHVTSLTDFEDDPKKSSEGILKAIQLAWFEEYKS